jgi:hypothetical protein
MVDPSVDRVSCPSFHAPPILKVSLTAHMVDVESHQSAPQDDEAYTDPKSAIKTAVARRIIGMAAADLTIEIGTIASRATADQLARKVLPNK